MAPALSQATAVWRQVDAASCDAELAVLWKEVARDGPVSRAIMSNLVVVEDAASPEPRPGRAPSDQDALRDDVVHVLERHPARVIVLRFSGAGAALGTAVGVLTFGKPPARYGVEAIVVSGIESERAVPAIVRKLVRGEVPTSLWWAGDLSRSAPGPHVTATARQLIYDSAAWRDPREGARHAGEILGGPHPPDIADVNWRRLGPLRQAIVHALDSEPRAREQSPVHVEVRYRRDEAAAARLLASWFRCDPARRRVDPPPVLSQGESDNAILTATLRGPSWTITVSMGEANIVVDCGSDRRGFEMPVPTGSSADHVVAELRNLGFDACLREAVLNLADAEW